MREIVFDTETTGLDPRSGDRMVEIGCIEVINRVPTGQTFHAYFNPARAMPAEAQAVHGLSDAFLSDKLPFAHHCEELLAFLGDCPLVAHNAGFDFAFLNAELALCGLGAIGRDRMVDTVALARAKHPGAKLSLDALCSRYGIDRSHRVMHGALLDAELLAQVYVELTGGRQIGLGLVADSIVSNVGAKLGGAIAAVRRRIFRPARPHAASGPELAAHAAFLLTVENPMWGEIPRAAGE
jgi:DNA polymerase-3 subunit epsilon